MFLKVKLLHICELVPTIYILINISQSPIFIYSISPRPATFLIDQSFRFCIIYIAYVKFRKNWSALTINYSADPKIQQYKAGLKSYDTTRPQVSDESRTSQVWDMAILLTTKIFWNSFVWQNWNSTIDSFEMFANSSKSLNQFTCYVCM